MKNCKSLFIGGSGHSGTTMLAHIFNNHSRSFGARGESRLIESLDLVRKEYHDLPDDQRIAFLVEKMYYGHQFRKDKYLYRERDQNPLSIPELESLESTSFTEDLNAIIHRVSEVKDLEFFIEKTPSNVYHIRDIFNTFPDSKVLIIQRDVRDVVASLKTRYNTLMSNPDVFSHNLKTKKLDKDYNLIMDSVMWNKGVLSWQKVDSPSLKVVKYEDFVDDPEKHTREICDWLNIAFEPEMIDLQARNSSDQQLAKEKGITKSSVKKYTTVLTGPELATVQYYSGKQLRSAGYESEELPWAQRIAVCYIIPREFFKILPRIYKRFRLMNFRYFLNFSSRFIKKLAIGKA